MHIIIVIVALLAIAYFIYQAQQPQAPSNTGTSAGPGFSNQQNPANGFNNLKIAFLSSGKLFYKAQDGNVKEIHSPYIQEIIDRTEKHRAQHAWKQNTTFGVSASGHMRQFESEGAQIIVTSLQFDENHRVLYFLKDEKFGGLFSYDIESGTENRLLHKQNLHLNDLNLDLSNGKMLCTSYTKNGIANIVMIDRNGDHYRELTGGDTLDSSPAWIPGEDKKILYQSAGLARDDAGYIIAQGNATIQMLDMQSGSVTAVMDDPRYDFLHPRVCSRGNLHFIRRPYELPKYRTENVIVDALLFPFRLLRAVFHYLNFFSMMYSRKPLTSASGPAVQADLKQILLKGKRIDAEKALRKETSVNGVPSLVPKTWQLISRNTRGEERLLACNVVSYDITPEGHIIYSNGRGVFLLADNGESKLVLKSDLVADVVAGDKSMT